MQAGAKRHRGALLDAAALILLMVFIADRFPLSLLLSDSIMTGGDAASWHQVALHLKNSLLPHGRLFGWDQSNFFGYPNLQYYFVPPFLLAVLLSYVMPLTVALKLVSFAGILALPLALYWALRKMDYPRPFPVAGAWVSLLFLFHERFVMFGGNAVSTLAGEFSYSLALVLMVLFMGSLHHGLPAGKHLLRNALLLGLIGLTHAFVFLTAVLMPLYFALRKGSLKERLGYLGLMYGLAFLVMAFWVLPMLALFDYTTPIKMIWRFYSLEQFLTTVNYELLGLALVLGLLFFLPALRRHHLGFHLYMLAVAAALYLAATLLKVADIRFFPFLVLFSLLLVLDAAASLVVLAPRRRGLLSGVVFVIAILLGGAWLYKPDLQAPAWFVWNYTGYEAKPAFKDGTMQQLAAALAAPAGAPRVAWEKFAYDGEFGSDRVFESMNLFTGRWSTEGIHYASALLSKPISYMHGEYSLHSAAPEDLIFSHYNMEIVPRRFRMFNIRDFIAASPEITRLFAASPDFSKTAAAGRYTIFSLREGAERYVESTPYTPQLLRLDGADWRQRFYAWFRRGADLDLALVSGHRATADERARYFRVAPAEIDVHGFVTGARRIPQARATVSDEALDDFTIRFRTDRPGIAHLIKVAYSPNWEAEGGESLFPVSPGFMLIFPQGEQVVLRYRRHGSEILGLVLTTLGGFLLVILAWRPRAAASCLRAQWIARLATGIERIRWPVYGVVLLVLIAGGVHGWREKQAVFDDYHHGTRLAAQGKMEDALVYFHRAGSDEHIAHDDNADVPAALYAAVRALRELGRDAEAIAAAERLLHYYPMWIYAHELHFHLGELYARRGERDRAVRHFQRCEEMDLFSSYHADCQTRLASLTRQQDVSDAPR